MFTALLSMSAGLCPNPGLEVELIPSRVKHFPTARTRQHEKPDCVRGDLLGMFGKGHGNACKLLLG